MTFNLSTAEVAALAIIFTFIGVLLNNGFNLFMHDRRLRFEGEQKEKERIHNLRKEIYLNAAEQSIRIGGIIADQTNVNVDLNQSKNEFNNFCSAMYKLQLVADIKLSKIVNGMIRDYTNLYLTSMVKTQELLELRIEVEGKLKIVEFSYKRINDIDKLSLLNNRSPVPDNILFTKLSNEREIYFSTNKEAHSEIEKLQEKITSLMKLINIETLEQVAKIRKNAIDFDLLLRLGIYGDKDITEYKERLEQLNPNHVEILKDVINKL